MFGASVPNSSKQAGNAVSWLKSLKTCLQIVGEGVGSWHLGGGSLTHATLLSQLAA